MRAVSAIADLAEDRVVAGVYAVIRTEKLRTRGGAPYLALELADASGRIDARVWNDVELLDTRFGEGDAVRVLGRVERFRNRLQLEVRTLEPAEVDAATLAPAMRRDAGELQGFLEFLVGEIHDDALRELVARVVADAPLRSYPATTDGHHSYAGGLLEHTVGVATICRELTQLHPRLRADLLLAAALVHDVGRTRELGPPPAFRPTEEGRLLGHVHLGLRVLEDAGAPAELLHAAAVPVTVGLATGDRPSALQIAGIVLALAGVGLASREHQEGGTRVAAGAGLALLAAVGFGGYFVPMHYAGDADFWWASLIFRSTSFAVIAIAVVASRSSVRMRAGDVWFVAAVGVGDTLGNVLFAASSGYGLVSVTSVLASLYPLVTVALARLVLRERVDRGQQAGAVATLAGI